MSTEPNEDLLVDLRNEVLRRVGRNLLLYQQIEMLMKFLVVNAVIDGGPSGPSAELLKRQAEVRKKSLGQIRGQFFEELYVEPAEVHNESPPTEIRFRSTFHISLSEAEQLARDQKKFEAMTDERNDLVHHFLESCALTDRLALEAALPRLNAQRENAIPLHDSLRQLHDVLVEGRRVMASFIQSPQGEAAIRLMLLQSSKIVTLLAQATLKHARKDGWTLLSNAGHFIAAEDPEQLLSIKRSYGHKGLQSLVAAADLFEIHEEVIGENNSRPIYRLRTVP